MGKFCSQCGRPLEEGEVCNCQAGQTQQQNQSNGFSGEQMNQTIDKITNETKSFLSRILPILKNPVEELKKIAKTNETAPGIQMIIINLVITFLAMIIFTFLQKLLYGGGMGYLTAYYIGNAIGSTILTAITYLIWAAATYFLWAAVLFGVTKTFAKDEQTTFASMLTIVGGKALYDTAIRVVGVLLMVVLSGFGSFVLAIGSAFTSILMIVTYCETVELEGSKKVYALAIAYACVILVSDMIMFVTSNSLFSSMVNSLGGIF